MGCLNSNESFSHWFANIHLTGPCNRSCYFCIGQHMMGLDHLNNLNLWPLLNLFPFVDQCLDHQPNMITCINLTGTNTDPLLYRHHVRLTNLIHDAGIKCGIRTNGVAYSKTIFDLYDKISITICSLNHAINQAMMGGLPPRIGQIMDELDDSKDLKVNIVLGPENVEHGDIIRTIEGLMDLGVTRINLREPYGQPRVGDPMNRPANKTIFGMPLYMMTSKVSVVYWDVHFVEVESLNLYASGRISSTYPITLGYDPRLGRVQRQSEFNQSGRQHEQWCS